MILEPLAPHHDAATFTCGTRRSDREMNHFLRKFGLDARQGQTYVVVPEPGASQIIAYYTIWPDPPVVLALAPDEELQINAIWLKRLAVARVYQRQGIGERLLVRIIRQTLQMANQHEVIESLVLEAIDAESKFWYLRRNFGFREWSPGSNFLALPVTTIRQLTLP